MKRVQFSSYFTQYFFIAPQLAIILIFLYLPIVQTFRDAFTIQDAFGFGRYFSGFDNFTFVLSDPNYITALKFTLIFIVVITFFSCSIGLLLAVQANNVIHGKSAYKTLLIWPYAIAPAVVGVTANYFLVKDLEYSIIFLTDFGVLIGMIMFMTPIFMYLLQPHGNK